MTDKEEAASKLAGLMVLYAARRAMPLFAAATQTMALVMKQFAEVVTQAGRQIGAALEAINKVQALQRAAEKRELLAKRRQQFNGK